MGIFDHFKRRSVEPKVVRSYEAAAQTQRRFGGWSQSFGPWAAEGSVAREPVQRRARHFAANNPLAHSGVTAWTTAAGRASRQRRSTRTWKPGRPWMRLSRHGRGALIWKG